MLEIILKSYMVTLSLIGVAAILLFIIGSYIIVRFIIPIRLPSEVISDPVIVNVNTKIPKKRLTISSRDIRAIAGEDVISTQLDLARAYIESGRKKLAKKILEHVMHQGSDTQQQEAKSLMALI